MKQGTMTQRIVIGDVGSGKTIIAFFVAISYLIGLDRGSVAILAPTEVLASQHYTSLLDILGTNKMNHIRAVFVTGKSILLDGKKLSKQKLHKFVEEVKPNHVIWVGTHALLHRDFIRPQLVLVDEQHRFGVRQRQFLASAEDELAAHFVSFTATPIPRTLALTLFKSLKPHFVETLKQRTQIATRIMSDEHLDESLFAPINRHLKLGRKVYVVCPRIEKEDKATKKEGDSTKLWSVEEVHALLEQQYGSRVTYVHGKAKEKQAILNQFKEDPETQILVSTTVIEVGIDVSEASLMIIMNGERFGLSALHQIRGRVGRNTYPDNECIVVSRGHNLRSQRLQYLVQYHSGFELAEKDLELRGSGNLIGTVQSGFSTEVDELLGLHPDLYHEVMSEVDDLFESDCIKDLPRLQGYIEREAAKVWDE